MSATATDKLWLRWPGHSSTPSLGRPPEPALATSRYIIMKRKDTRLVAHELVVFQEGTNYWPLGEEYGLASPRNILLDGQ